jgi:periplasmic protein TonB
VTPADDPLVPDDRPGNGPPGEVLRLILLPSLAALLFVGGVYWLRLQVDAAGGQPETTNVIEVKLLPRPDPIPLPVKTSTATSLSTPADTPHDNPATAPEETVASLPSQEPAAAASPSTSAASPRAKADVAPDPATLQFRATLLRHIARFQRYPRAAHADALEGTVKAMFAVKRDGRLLGVWITGSSGKAILDQAAIDTIQRAQPLPPIPAALPDPISVEISLGFDPS